MKRAKVELVVLMPFGQTPEICGFGGCPEVGYQALALMSSESESDEVCRLCDLHAPLALKNLSALKPDVLTRLAQLGIRLRP